MPARGTKHREALMTDSSPFTLSARTRSAGDGATARRRDGAPARRERHPARPPRLRVVPDDRP